MAFLMRWFSRFVTSLQSCIKVPQDTTQTIEEDDLKGIHFWEDIVKRQKYQRKEKNRKVKKCSFEEMSTDPKIEDFEQTHKEMSVNINLTDIQSSDSTPEESAHTSEESTTDEPEHITENSSIELFNSVDLQQTKTTEKDKKNDDSDTTTTENETDSSYLPSEESKTRIDYENCERETEKTGLKEEESKTSEKDSETQKEQVESETTGVVVQIVEVANEQTDSVIPSTTDEDTSNSNKTESQSSEEFDAMDIWLEADELQPPDTPFVMERQIEGTDSDKELPSDILLIVKEKQFRVHQKILRQHSLYFEQRLTGKIQTYCVLHIQSANIDPNALNILLHIMYNCQLITCQNIPQVIHTAMYLEIAFVLKKMEQILDISNTNSKRSLYLYATAWEWMNQLESAQSQEAACMQFNQTLIKNNFLDLTENQMELLCSSEHIEAKRFNEEGDTFHQIAVKPKIIVLKGEPLTIWAVDVCHTNFENAIYMDVDTWKNNLQKKISQSLDFLALHFEEVITHNLYLHLDKNQIETLFKKDILQARSEMIVFLAALKWIEHDFLEREEFTADILNCVRFSQMTKEEIIACYHPPVLMGLIELPDVQDMLHKALQYVIAKDIYQENLFQNFSSEPRTLLQKGKTLTLWDMDAYDPNLTTELQSGTSNESNLEEKQVGQFGGRNQAPESPTLESSASETKKTHLSKFIDLFEDDL